MIGFQFDNDVMLTTDQFYSNGVDLYFINPELSKLPFLIGKKHNIQSGIRLTSNIFTPTDIYTSEILRGDRPYASTLTVSFFGERDLGNGFFLDKSWRFGWLGANAQGDFLQEEIHDWTGSTPPMGWKYQIANEPIANLSLNLRKELVKTSHLRIEPQTFVNVGNLYTNIGTGLALRVGNFETKTPFRYGLHLEGKGIIPIYDATLQGGLINGRSPYHLSKSDLSPVVGHLQARASLGVGPLDCSFTLNWLSSEIRHLGKHSWAGIGVTYSF